MFNPIEKKLAFCNLITRGLKKFIYYVRRLWRLVSIIYPVYNINVFCYIKKKTWKILLEIQEQLNYKNIYYYCIIIKASK